MQLPDGMVSKPSSSARADDPSFEALPQKEQNIQLEEAFGRATVALARARSLCIIMGPLT